MGGPLPPVNGSGGGGVVETSRFEKSLGLLTSKFVTLLQTAPQGVLDLKKVRTHCHIMSPTILYRH